MFVSAQMLGSGWHRLISQATAMRRSQARPASLFQSKQRNGIMNRIIWIVGAVVIVLFVLGYFGYR